MASILVRALPFRAGSMPELSSITSWLAPLKVLPAVVTLAPRRALLKVPEVMALALRPDSPAPLPVKELAGLMKLLMPVKVWS